MHRLSVCCHCTDGVTVATTDAGGKGGGEEPNKQNIAACTLTRVDTRNTNLILV
jgi:hypothetical protein